MADDMIERAAKVAYQTWQKAQGFGAFPPWPDIPPMTKALYISVQRAAIEAMREPTEAMIDAGERVSARVGAIDCHTQIDLPASPAEVWCAMIDAVIGAATTEGVNG
jgi:hypothetical protein